MARDYCKLKVLYVTRELRRWVPGANPDYATQLGYDEAFHNLGIDCTTLTMPWFESARRIIGSRKFDLLWIELVWSDYDPAWLDWVMSLAPVRVSWIPETLQYTEEEITAARAPGGGALLRRMDEVERRLRMITHALPVDEADLDHVRQRCGVEALWAPVSMVERLVNRSPGAPLRNVATFMGTLRPERAALMDQPDMKEILVRLQAPEHGTNLPQRFFRLHLATYPWQKFPLPGTGAVYSAYINGLRKIRREIYQRWLKEMSTGAAVVNLPGRVKTHAGRVTEGIAAGRPVITNRIPEHPRTNALYEPEKEILLYCPEQPEQLAEQIRSVLRDPARGEQIAAAAREKLLRFHTTERRVTQVLDWIYHGEQPGFG